jgi:hypothetical protein
MDHPLFIVLNGFDLGRKNWEFFSYLKAVLPFALSMQHHQRDRLDGLLIRIPRDWPFTKSSATLPLSSYLRSTRSGFAAFFSYRKPTKVRLFRVQFDSHFDAERAFR